MSLIGTDSDLNSCFVIYFIKPSLLRIVIATTTFGISIDCPNVRLVIHLGTRSESYVQKVGRALRDKFNSYAVLLHSAMINFSEKFDQLC